MTKDFEALLDSILERHNGLHGVQTTRLGGSNLAAENCPDCKTTKKVLLKAHTEAVVAALQALKEDIEGVGSKGDKINGDPKFMMGIECVENVIEDRLAQLRQPAEGVESE